MDKIHFKRTLFLISFSDLFCLNKMFVLVDLNMCINSTLDPS